MSAAHCYIVTATLCNVLLGTASPNYSGPEAGTTHANTASTAASEQSTYHTDLLALPPQAMMPAFLSALRWRSKVEVLLGCCCPSAMLLTTLDTTCSREGRGGQQTQFLRGSAVPQAGAQNSSAD